MKKEVRQVTKVVGTLALVSVFVVSCGPVNFLTRAKKVPREHSLNYYSDQIAVKANRGDINKDPWIVYAQRDELVATNQPGGKVKAAEVNYLDAFLVIKQKGEYLALVKYNEGILKNGKLDYKQAEFIGWLPKRDLVVENQSYTDKNSIRKRKYITALSDSISLFNQEKLFSKDSILTYKDFEYKKVAQKIAFMDIVYPLKEDLKSKKVLIAKKPYIKADQAKEDIIGWIDQDLIQYKGQVLNIAGHSLFSNKDLKFKELDSLSLDDYSRISFEHNVLKQKSKVLTYNPVLSYSTSDSLIAFISKVSMPVFDNSKNYIYNVQGDKITHFDAFVIDKKAKQMNISFVFEQSDQVNKQYAQLVNAIQSLQGFFGEYQQDFNFKFSVYFSQRDSGGNKIYTQPWTGDFSQMVNYIIDNAKQSSFSRESSTGRYQVLEQALASFSGKEGEQNLIVLFGQKGIESTSRVESIKRQLNKNQVKLLAFQMFSDLDNSANDFVLNITDFIGDYAQQTLTKKKRVWVSPKQVKYANYFVALGDYKNSYMLDFPNASATQGMVVFPAKNESITMDMIGVALDTLVKQIKIDKTGIQQGIAKSFKETGNNRTIYSPYFKESFYKDTTRVVDKTFLRTFSDQKTLWYMEANPVFTTKEFNKSAKYALLLDKQEYEELKSFVEDLSKYEVELAYQALSGTKNKSYVDDERDLFRAIMLQKQKDLAKDNYNDFLDWVIDYDPNSYANTDKVRRHLYNMYMKALASCTYCHLPSKTVKKTSIAKAQLLTLGAPTTTYFLENFNVKDIKDKNKLKDKQLDFIITYFKEKKKELDKAEKFESLGQTYYWLPTELLP